MKPRSNTPHTFFSEFDPLQGKRLQVADEHGNVVSESYMPKLSEEQMRQAFLDMLRVRGIDERILSLQRQGRMLTYASNKGQEAAQIGSVRALAEQDWITPTYREMGAWLHKGLSLTQFLQHWNGMEEGFRLDPRLRLLCYCVPIATQTVHAVGIGMAIRFRKEDAVVVAYCGDGGTSQGDFHEALNFASVFDAPVIFFVNNNQYAISVPLSKQTHAHTLAQKAVAYDIPGIQVDGNDFFSVYQATSQAVAHARAGKGPVLIEAFTYRLGPHTTSDDPTLYRSREEEQTWMQKEPLTRMRSYLQKNKLWTQKWEDDFQIALEKEMNVAIEAVEKNLETPLEDIFMYHFKEIPVHLQRELAEYQDFKRRKRG